MKQRDFNAFRSPEAERFSGRQFHDAVQTLDNARRNGAFSLEPVEDQIPVTPQTLGHLLDRLQRAPHAAGAPRVKQSPGRGHPFYDHPTRRALHPPPTRRRRTPHSSRAAQTRTVESKAGRTRAASGRQDTVALPEFAHDFTQRGLATRNDDDAVDRTSRRSR